MASLCGSDPRIGHGRQHSSRARSIRSVPAPCPRNIVAGRYGSAGRRVVPAPRADFLRPLSHACNRSYGPWEIVWMVASASRDPGYRSPHHLACRLGRFFAGSSAPRSNSGERLPHGLISESRGGTISLHRSLPIGSSDDHQSPHPRQCACGNGRIRGLHPKVTGWLNVSFLRFNRRYRAIFGYGALIAGLGFVATWCVSNSGLLHSN
jgi:hypothetical protein